MQEKYLDKLEYYKILEILQTFCSTYLGQEFCTALKPVHTKGDVLNLLLETTEAVSISRKKRGSPFCFYSTDTIISSNNRKRRFSFSESFIRIGSYFKISKRVKRILF